MNRRSFLAFLGMAPVIGAAAWSMAQNRRDAMPVGQVQFYNPNGMVGRISTKGSETRYG